MSKIWLIAGKEVRAYFDSPAAYVFMVLFLIMAGIYVVGNIFLEEVASLRLLFEVAPIVMLVFVPAVTMRLLSEEKQVGTFELLRTRPISIGEIVLGKFLASSLLVVCTIVPTIIYAVILSSLGNLDWGPVAGGYMGLVLLGGSFVAIGLFSSAVSDNQIISLIVGTILVSCLFFLDRLLPFLPPALIMPVEYLSAGYHFSSLERGILDSRDLVYSASVIILFLLLATVAAMREYGESFRDWRRVLPRDQGLRIILVGIALMLANIVSGIFFFRGDLTEGGMFTLSSVTRGQLSALDDNILVRAYLTPDLPPPYHHYRRDIQDLLEEYYVYSGGRVQYRFINPLDTPGGEKEATEAGVSPIFVKIVKNDKIQTAKAYAGLAFAHADRFKTLPVISSVDRLEYELTSAIKHLTTPNAPTIGLLAGHGSPGAESMRVFLDALGKHYRITSVVLSNWNPSPAEVAALLIIGPRLPFAVEEKLLLDQYIMRGGRVAFLLDAVSIDRQQQVAKRLDLNLDDLFDTYGWIVNSDLVVDMRCGNTGAGNSSAGVTENGEGPNPFFPVITDFNKNNAMVTNLPPVLLPYVSSIDARLATIRGIGASVVASSSAQSARMTGDSISINIARVRDRISFWEGHIPLAAIFEGSFKSLFGGLRNNNTPVQTGVQSTTLAKSAHTKIVVVGNGNFLLDGSLHGYHNATFALNLVDWLVDETGLGSIRTREVALPPLDEVSEETRTRIRYVAFAGPPVLVIIAGLLRMVMKASRRRIIGGRH